MKFTAKARRLSMRCYNRFTDMFDLILWYLVILLLG
jgi:hypothetical protein